MNYIPTTNTDKNEMLKQIGISSVEDLFVDIPDSKKLKSDLKLPSPLDEMGLLKELESISKKNTNLKDCISFLGGGAYNHYVPSVVGHITSRAEFYTAYTPYQPEISQGLLQVIYEYQSMICRITGMDGANASLYDGATAVAEAAMLAMNATKRKEILVSHAVNPNHRKVLATMLEGTGAIIKEVDVNNACALINGNTATIIIQQPNFFGCIEDVIEIEKTIHDNGGLFIVSVDPLSLGLLKSPGEYGADIVVAEGQGMGIKFWRTLSRNIRS